MDIASLFGMLTNNSMLEKLGGTVGADKSQVQKLVNLGMPTLLKAMDRNAQSENGAQSLYNALQKHQDDNVEDWAQNLDRVDTTDGSKILNHIFQDKQERVQTNLAKQTHMESNQVSTLLSQLAPLLMGTLGQQQKQQGVDVSGLSNLLGGAAEQTGGSGIMKVAEQLLDKDKDGSIIDDIGRIFSNLFKRKK